MSIKKLSVAATVALCSGLAAQSADTWFSRSVNGTEVACSDSSSAAADFVAFGWSPRASVRVNNDTDFAIGGTDFRGIEVEGYCFGSLSNWSGRMSHGRSVSVRAGGNTIASQYFGNARVVRNYSGGTLADEARSYRVGPYTVSATIRVAADANVDLSLHASSSSGGRVAMVSGSTRTNQNGRVWNVAGSGGAVVSFSQTLNMGGTTSTVDLDSTMYTVGGTMTVDAPTVRLHMRASVRRYWWESWTRRTLLNASSNRTVRNLTLN